MKAQVRIPVLIAAGFGVAGAIYYLKKRQDKSIGMDLIVPGLALSVGFNVIGWLITDMGVKVPLLSNPMEGGMGAVGKAAIEVLEKINPSELYRDLKQAGLRIEPIPDNPSVIVQDDV